MQNVAFLNSVESGKILDLHVESFVIMFYLTHMKAGFIC